ACGVYYPELKKIESEFGASLKVIFRENPLYPNHEYSIIAAQAAEAAGLQGEAQFWAMHDKLYENQKTWAETKDRDAVVSLFAGYATEIGLNTDRFMRDLNGEAVAQRIFQDGKRSHALGISQTPTFVVNGKEATGESWKPDGLRQMINEALREAGQ
ncbi:MAG TPA: thioredoxin domain-containing protein, partial [Pyrinomonadaceae bacterium]|nr:thioredoxin domain-containing protein [Pyrinomonadaceae bacterium]